MAWRIIFWVGAALWFAMSQIAFFAEFGGDAFEHSMMMATIFMIGAVLVGKIDARRKDDG